jgi:N-methylhydantoinase B
MTVHSAVAQNSLPATRVNPVTAAVIHGALENIAIEMGHKLMRMAYSSIIRESEDFGAALTDSDGGQLCECKMSTPLQSGPIPGYIRGIRKELKRRGEATSSCTTTLTGVRHTAQTSPFACLSFLTRS